MKPNAGRFGWLYDCAEHSDVLLALQCGDGAPLHEAPGIDAAAREARAPGGSGNGAPGDYHLHVAGRPPATVALIDVSHAHTIKNV